MPTIQLRTEIKASRELVFDLSRSVDLHRISTRQSGEVAVAGTTSGLMGLNDTVTWQARHFGIRQRLASTITDFDRPNFFADEMVSGAFRSFRHEHHFAKMNGGTLMLDRFAYRSPLGFLGRIADALFLKRYMTELLTQRNAVIKDHAETGKWQEVLGGAAVSKGDPNNYFRL